MPVLNEFYVKFWQNRVIIGMLFIGILFGILTKIFSFKKLKI